MEHVVTASEANQRFSSLLKKVKQGDKVVITSRGEAVAELVPSRKRTSQKDVDELLGFLDTLPRRTFNWTREDAYD
jgi:prevent-host-death family protein